MATKHETSERSFTVHMEDGQEMAVPVSKLSGACADFVAVRDALAKVLTDVEATCSYVADVTKQIGERGEMQMEFVYAGLLQTAARVQANIHSVCETIADLAIVHHPDGGVTVLTPKASRVSDEEGVDLADIDSEGGHVKQRRRRWTMGGMEDVTPDDIPF